MKGLLINSRASGVIAVLVLVMLAGCQTAPGLPLESDPFAATAPPRPAVGDTYVYRFLDGYGNKASGQVVYRVDDIGVDRIVWSVTPSLTREGVARTEIHTRDGNWLRAPLNNHDQPVEYQFAPAYPAYAFPLAPDKSWSLRVHATNPGAGRRSVRVDGKILGAVRIRVPAGEFDTIRIRRMVYAGDMDYLSETQIAEVDWYAPALGRAVRTERQAVWRDNRGHCNAFGCDSEVRGEWHVYELESYPIPAR